MDEPLISAQNEPQPLIFREDTETVLWLCASCNQIHLDYQTALDCCKQTD